MSSCLLIAQALALVFEFRQFRCNYTRTAQQIERCTLRLVDLPRNTGREPQTGFGVACTQCLAHKILVIPPKGGVIQKFYENSGLGLENGIPALGRYLRPLRDGFDGHSGIALTP